MHRGSVGTLKGGIVLLNLVFELKYFDVFMGREDPVEFDIYLAFILLFVCFCFKLG